MHEVELFTGIHNGLTYYGLKCDTCGLIADTESSKTLASVRADMHAYDPYKELSDADAEAKAIEIMRKYLA